MASGRRRPLAPLLPLLLAAAGAQGPGASSPEGLRSGLQSPSLGQLPAPGPMAKQQRGLHEWELTVGGHKRHFMLYVPLHYHGPAMMPLWILVPGAYNSPEKQLRMCDMVSYAEQQQFAFVVLKGDRDLMNVVLHSQPEANKPDDVMYTRAVLDVVSRAFSIDQSRIFCTGYSRGGRFCARLASEMSDVFAAVAPVSGIRFPWPNNATRAMPIITFHGTNDPINPYEGDGNPTYWHESVQGAVLRWAKFNGCKNNTIHRLSTQVVIERHHDCIEDADVVLVRIKDGGHTWPGSLYNFAGEHLGFTTHDIDAFAMMWQFFSLHRLGAAKRSRANVSREVLWWGLRDLGQVQPPLAGRLGALPAVAACAAALFLAGLAASVALRLQRRGRVPTHKAAASRELLVAPGQEGSGQDAEAPAQAEQE